MKIKTSYESRMNQLCGLGPVRCRPVLHFPIYGASHEAPSSCAVQEISAENRGIPGNTAIVLCCALTAKFPIRITAHQGSASRLLAG